MDKKGKLYGIGVGPGDPDYLTIKAVNILKKVEAIYCACSTKNRHSIAYDIASKYIPENTPIKFLPFPMILDRDKAENYWENHAHKVLDDINNGKEIAFLTVGDPLTYSTFGYLMKSIKKIAPNTDIEVVPGITSYQAAAAASNTILVEAEEVLTVISGVKGGEYLRRLDGLSENIVFLKAYKNIDDIILALQETDRLEKSIAVIKCGFEDEVIIKDIKILKKEKPNYWTIIISKK